MTWAILLALVLIPLVFAAMIPSRPTSHAKGVALAGMILPLFALVFLTGLFDWSRPHEMQHEATLEWLPTLGLALSVGVDGVSMLLIILAGLLGPICVLGSFTAIRENEKTFYSWLLILQSAMFGVFMARDLVLFYLCFEFTLVPMYVLISLFGSSNRKAAATKFFLYTFTGSIVALAGLVYVVVYAFQTTGLWTMDIGALGEAARGMSLREQVLVMVAMLLGFGVKVPLFPFHTWLPLAHTEAPTAGSVVLAGVLLKLGTYGLYRFVLPFTPAAIVEYAPLLGVVCIVGILYGGLICWVQTDVKKLVAYSSVAHLGFCVLGMLALNATGLQGSVLYMINHGLSTGALFLLIGMVYERHHTRSMRELGGLASRMPVWSTFMVFFAMASVGLPGLNGFVSEFLCLLGTFQSSDGWGRPDVAGTPGLLGPWYAVFAGFGMVVAAIYLLFMVGKVVWGPLVLPGGAHKHNAHGHGDGHKHDDDHLPTDLTFREVSVLAPLAVLCIALGLFPQPVMAILEQPVNQTVRLVIDHREAPSPATRQTTPSAPAPAATPVVLAPTSTPEGEQ